MHPFRLKNDPTSCGDPRYELSCENNMTMLTLFSGKYYVKAINYKNYTIRLVDPGIQEDDCSSIPHNYLYTSNFTSYYRYLEEDPYETKQYRIISDNNTRGLPMFQHVIYMNCSNPVRDDPAYADTASCINGGHVYAIAGDLKVGNLKDDDCHVEFVTAISYFGYNYSSSYWDIPNQKSSYSEIHRMLEGGFEVSWMSNPCEDLCGEPNCYLSEITWSLECPTDQCITKFGFHIDCGGPGPKLRMFIEGKKNFVLLTSLIMPAPS
ncbi:stress-induced receptor-like kinase [Trifolium pratense]|uniref:Stress-induced receptor-like kinase n=1 Tax=Trifolium pratense TaxID=57577 RepID=A0A2K3LQ31_TRIPR|nr:stress-induced receptor-like kinase [Trifolium pratense]